MPPKPTVDIQVVVYEGEVSPGITILLEGVALPLRIEDIDKALEEKGAFWNRDIQLLSFFRLSISSWLSN